MVEFTPSAHRQERRRRRGELAVFLAALAVALPLLFASLMSVTAVVLAAVSALAVVRRERFWRGELRPTPAYWWGQVRVPEGRPDRPRG